ncbi:hypothetical protein OJ997_21085 [Solirubrobacter phytolaccae]|uniref:Uncharacterized protein n=1 Tax=Solirubrobacter phytolaccae TaxID=1404360 RepID=A0A9X3NDE0_9ACTN|nr:hypothetical protein [Solirubrobacter phytolaccae]MDA0182820.1 hypothetical protein [Solirubrobacter phytolaccae]
MKSRLLILAALLVVALPTATAHAVEPNGSFIRTTNNGWTYRVIGGSALRITNCTNLNACEGRVDVPSLAGYRQYPVDGSMVRNVDDTGVYRFVNGTPLWVSKCTYAACTPRFDVTDSSMRDPAHTRTIVPDGTVIRNGEDGGFYRFAGGAPLFVRCDMGAGCAGSPILFDNGTLSKLGTYSPEVPRMRQFPANGAVVYNGDDNAHYRIAGGAPLLIAAPASGAKQIIDSRTLVQQGTATTALPHLKAYPDDNTFLTAGGGFWRVAGGAAVQLTNCAVLGNCAGAVPVDPATISGLAGGRLLAVPRDGTVLRGIPSNVLWEIVSGQRRQTYVNVPGVSVDDGAVGLIPVPAGPQPVVLPPSFKPVISSGYKVYRRYTRFTSLKVRDAPAGAVITVSCSGKKKGCPFKKQKYYRLTGSSLNIQARWFKKAKLKNKATVVVRVSSPGGERKQMEFKIRSRKLPVRTTRCAAAGGKLGKCAA